MAHDEIIDIMNDMVENSKLDAKIVNSIIHDIEITCELVKKDIYK